MTRSKKILLLYGILVVFILILGFFFQDPIRYFSQPFIEKITGEMPEAKVNEYLEAVMRDDQEEIFKIWQLLDCSKEETIFLLSNRRQDISEELIAEKIKDFEILNIDWWSTCCIPTIINNHSETAGFARVRVKLIMSDDKEIIYIFDLFTQKEYCCGLCGYQTRHWTIRDVYQSGQNPLLWTTRSWEGKETTWGDKESEENLTHRQIVEKFIEADMVGARLGGEIAKEAPEIKKYYTLSSRFPSGFVYEGDLAMVIKKYEIIDEYPSENESSYFIKVRYFCKEGIASGFTEGARNIETGEEISIEDMGSGPGLVSFDCDYFYNSLADSSIIKYDSKTQTETITFELIKDKGQWKLNSPSICPRISEETLKKHLEIL